MAKPVLAVVPLDLSNIATGNALSTRPATHLGELEFPSLVWQSSGNSNLWVRGQFSAATAVDFVAMLNANALAGTTIRVRLGTTQAQVDGTAPYDSGAVAFINPSVTRASGLYHSYLEIASAVTASWWRIDIAGHTGDFSAASLVMGKRFQPARYYDNNFEFGSDDLGSIDFSPMGVPTVTDGVVFRTLAFKLSWLTKAEYHASMRPIIEGRGKRKPLFLCFDPEADAYRQENCYFGWLKTLPFATARPKPGIFAMDVAISSMI